MHIAQELGVAATPARTQNLELCLDTADIKAAGPFWAAVLGYDWDEEHLEIVDPDGRMPTAWFQQTDAHESTGNPASAGTSTSTSTRPSPTSASTRRWPRAASW